MSTIDSANPPQEFPDIVGARPTNPLAANFKSFIPASAHLPELTWPHLITGTILGIIFGASSLYLVLKVGLTVSASIPVAVLSITIFRVASKLFRSRDATILQNNIVQTAGSAGESIAFGLGVTMPAIMILGFDLEITRVMLVAVLGGLLGILMMIPLRRALIVAEHGVLKYPEGTACAEVLKAAVSKESIAVADKTHTTANAEIVNEEAASGGGKVIFTGFGIGFLYQAAMGAFRMWKDTPEKIFGAPFKGASISATIEPALLGVGYIIGPRIASIMCAGGVLSYLVLIPAIKFFGDNVTGPRCTRNHSYQPNGTRRYSRGVYSLHRRGSSCCWWNHQLVSIDSHNLAWIARRIVGSAGPTQFARTCAANGPRFVDARRDHWLPCDHRSHHGSSAVASAWKFSRCISDRAVQLYVRHCIFAIDRRDWFVFNSDFRNDRGDFAAHVPGVPDCRLDRLRPISSQRFRLEELFALLHLMAAQLRRI